MFLFLGVQKRVFICWFSLYSRHYFSWVSPRKTTLDVVFKKTNEQTRASSRIHDQPGHDFFRSLHRAFCPCLTHVLVRRHWEQGPGCCSQRPRADPPSAPRGPQRCPPHSVPLHTCPARPQKVIAAWLPAQVRKILSALAVWSVGHNK